MTRSWLAGGKAGARVGESLSSRLQRRFARSAPALGRAGRAALLALVTATCTTATSGAPVQASTQDHNTEVERADADSGREPADATRPARADADPDGGPAGGTRLAGADVAAAATQAMATADSTAAQAERDAEAWPSFDGDDPMQPHIETPTPPPHLPMADRELTALLQDLRDPALAAERTGIVTRAAARAYFTCEQVMQMFACVDTDAERLQVAGGVASRLTDRESAGQLLDAVAQGPSREALRAQLDAATPPTVGTAEDE